jgi:hypothetical protein
VPALLPAGYAGMQAQYSLLDTVAGVDVDDRSGTSKPSLSQPGLVRGPDAIPLRSSFVTGVYPGYSAAIGSVATAQPLLPPTPEMTIIARVVAQYSYVSAPQCVVTMADRPNPAAISQYYLGISDTGKVVSYWQGASAAVFAAGPDLRDGAWHVVGMTRNATSTQSKLYVDGMLVGTSGVLPAVTPNASCKFFVGQNSNAGGLGSASNEWWCGQMADLNIAFSALSDAQMMAAANIMLGR